MAGLYAALLLQTHGYRVRIFEGTDRVGGRIYTHYFTQEKDQYFETGAMRIPRSDFQRYTLDLIDWVHQFVLPSNKRIELIPYLQTATGNRLYINDTHHDGLHTSSSTPQTNWKVPDEFRNRTADDLLKAAIGSFIETLQDNLE